MLSHKKILIGVTGSIAAYKTALLIRLLIKEKAEVKVIMTHSATTFITPLTLSTLSKNPVFTNFEKKESGEWNNHVELALWADAMIIAPASANTISKCAIGLCDNLLMATYLSAKCPVYFAPAMDLDMYRHPSIVNNLEQLRGFGNHIIPAENGELASGLSGEGRMAEPENILQFVSNFFSGLQNLKNKKVLITAGPTYEPLDPVRFIGNHSTGKMGYAIAKNMALHGAEVELVSGPTFLNIDHPNIKITKITSADEMYQKSLEIFPGADIIILAAAVADYKPQFISPEKIKKKEQEFNLPLIKTVDIASMLGNQKQAHQIIVGFALETENEVENAETKLHKKNLDMIILNSLRDNGAGFGYDTNKITVIEKSGHVLYFDLKSKAEVAEDITRLVAEMLN